MLSIQASICNAEHDEFLPPEVLSSQYCESLSFWGNHMLLEDSVLQMTACDERLTAFLKEALWSPQEPNRIV
jgi:hypothetical protein